MAEHHQEDNHNARVSVNRLWLTLGIVVFIMVAEVIGGILSDSLALLSDAGHMLVDALALGLSIFAIIIARRPATLRRTYGYLRVEIMAALINGTALILISAVIFYEAYQRILAPPEVDAPLMLVISAIGLVSNAVGIMLLRGASHHSLNIKAAFWHVVGDTLSSIGVVVAGIIILLTGRTIADPIIAILIGIIVLWGAVSLVRESLDILLEAVPKNIRVEDVVASIKKVPGVEEVHDIHVWTLTSGVHALSAHLLITDQSVSSSAGIVAAVNDDLSHRFKIMHTTLQLECARCKTCPIGYTCDIGVHRND